MKKLFTLITVLVALFGAFALSNVKDVEAADLNGGEKLFLKPSDDWRKDGARFAIYLFGGSNGEKWVSMTDGDADGIYEVTVPTGNYKKVIFCRMNGSNSTNDWNNKWNQTGDLTYTAGKPLYYVEGWDGKAWAEFDETSFKLVGTMTSWDAPLALVNVPGTTKYEAELMIDKGTHEFKIIKGGEWLGNNGSFTDTNVKDGGWNMSLTQGSNCGFITSGGYYKFSLDAKTTKITVTHKSYTELVNDLNTLISPYYNNGVYRKDTVINLKEDAMNELATQYTNKGFHASVTELTRTTYYNGGSLWMSREDGKYSYYGTSGSDMTNGVVATVGETSDRVVVKGKTMEEYYVTLADIVATSAHAWTYANGVYTTTHTDVLDWFKAFTAPCYLGLDAKTANYITFTSATIQETAEGLVLQLHASADAPKFTSGDVFSQAIITKGN